VSGPRTRIDPSGSPDSSPKPALGSFTAGLIPPVTSKRRVVAVWSKGPGSEVLEYRNVQLEHARRPTVVSEVRATVRAPRMSFWDSFWPGLWSNALATLIGVGVGVPIALAIDRRFRSERKQAEQVEQTNRLLRVLDTLRSSIEDNVLALQALVEAVADEKVPLSVSFNAAVWEAVRPDVVSLLDDPGLQVLLATFFEDLGEMSRLQQHLIDVTVGVGASVGGSKDVRDRLFGIIETGAKVMVERSADLLAKIERRKASAEAG